jgi:hypothetical protein
MIKKQILTEEFKRMQQLAGIITEMPIIKNPTTKIISYFTHQGETAIFQTEKGINIMKQILDDFNKTHPDNNTNSYATFNPDNKEDFNEIINHPLYNSFKKEGEVAYKILDPLIKNFNKTHNATIDFIPSAYLPYGDNDDELYVGPEAYLEEYDYDVWNGVIEVWNGLKEYLIKQLDDRYTNTTEDEESWKILLTLIND